MNNYDECDALDLAMLIRRRKASARELLDEAWSRTQRVNEDLNAIVWADIDRARHAIESGLPEGPFQGVPFVVKDILATIEGFRSTAGSRLFKDIIATEDSELVKRHRAAGFVFFGMTTTPELGMNPTAEAKVYGGPSRNPWNRAHSTGGSSGGAAAAVAVGILPLTHGSDGGGSIRVPASACGVFGLKPTRGRNPMGPKIGETWGGLGVEHALSRSVRDSAALLDWTQGMDPGAPYSAPPVEGSYLDATLRAPRSLRIGLVTDCPGGFPVHADCIRAVSETAKLCEELGHNVEPARYVDYDFESVFNAHLLMMAAGSAAFLQAGKSLLGREPTEHEVEPSTLDSAKFALGKTATEYGISVALLHTLGRRMSGVMAKYDVLLTPTLLQPPLKLGELDTNSDFVPLRQKIIRYTGFLPIANFTGLPAMSVPLMWNDAGLPIGSHFVGQWAGERTLFALAAQLERARPWFSQRPGQLAKAGC
jgi:amidase